MAGQGTRIQQLGGEVIGHHHWRCYPEVEGLRSYLDNLTFRLSAWKVALSTVLRLHCSVQLIQLQF